MRIDGFGTPEQSVDRLLELGQTACAVTDHGNCFAHLEWSQTLSKSGIKPILGIEFYHAQDMTKKGKSEEEKEAEKGSQDTKTRSARAQIAHITIIAKNLVGYRNLLKLSRMSYEIGYYYVPRIDINAIVKHQEGLYVFSGCVGGIISRLINDGKEGDAYKWVAYMKKTIENFFVEIVPCPTLDISIKACCTLVKIAKSLNVPMVVTSDSHFPRPEDYVAEDTMVCVSMKDRMDGKRKIKLPEYHYLCSQDEISNRTFTTLFPLVEQGYFSVQELNLEIALMVDNTRHIADSIDFELPKSKGPIYATPPETTPRELLIKWIDEGRAFRESIGQYPREGEITKSGYTRGDYLLREERELGIIDFHGFHNYFLIVTDLVRWCMESNKLVIARGSCGGSLLCFLLGITQIDPVQFQLPVERFIDETRPDLPDIDLDFDGRHRDAAFEFLTNKYGHDKCAQIAALSYYRGRAAIRDVATVYGIPRPITDDLCRFIPESLDADEGTKSGHILERVFDEVIEIQPILKQYPQFRLASKLEGQIRQSTVHAAGFIIDSRPLEETVGIIAKPGTLPIVACDKSFAAKQGLLKIDCLNVDTLSVIAETLEVIGKEFRWLFSLPLDDKSTFDMLAEGRNVGVFQLQGTACTNMLPRLKPSNFEEFYAVSALARPGPLQSGGATEYIERKWGRSPLPNYHPVIMDIVKDTYGVIIYQEQVQHGAVFVGDLGWPAAHKIRKMITDKAGANKVNEYYPEYLKNGLAKGIPENQLEHFWGQCIKAGNYVFNKAHVAAYGLVGYWTAYLKAHYPSAFITVSAKYTGKKSIKLRLFREFKETGGKLVLIDPNLSKVNFSTGDNNSIIGGFSDLYGIGEKTAGKLVEMQPFDGWEDFLEACPKRVREGLIASGIVEGNIDSEIALQVAPWFVDINLNRIEKALRLRNNLYTIEEIEEGIESGRILKHVAVIGKIITLELVDIRKAAQKYGRTMPKEGEPYIRLVLEIADETGSIEVYYSAYKLDKILKAKPDILTAFKTRGGAGKGLYITADVSEDRSKFWGKEITLLEVKK